jgi:integrase
VLRHTFASLLLQPGESLVYVKEHMGHASIQVTLDIYGIWCPAGTGARSIALIRRVHPQPRRNRSAGDDRSDWR